MAAHVGTEGIYLDSSGGWYPSLYRDPEEPARGELADYRLIADTVDGMELVAGAAFDARASARTGRLVWKSKYPLDGLALVGGPHQDKRDQQKQHDDRSENSCFLCHGASSARG